GTGGVTGAWASWGRGGGVVASDAGGEAAGSAAAVGKGAGGTGASARGAAGTTARAGTGTGTDTCTGGWAAADVAATSCGAGAFGRAGSPVTVVLRCAFIVESVGAARGALTTGPKAGVRARRPGGARAA